MNNACRALLGSAIAIALSVPALAQGALTVDQIVALNATGIGDEAIIAKIRSAGTSFDLTADQMISLKGKGVSGPVIAAMLSGGGGSKPATLSIDSADPAAPHAAGVYLLQDWLPQPKMNRIDATASNQAKTGGIFGYALTGGIASMSVKAAIQNSTARVQSQTKTPVFYFFFDESNPNVGQQSATWASGTAAIVSSPAEFTLIRLEKKNGRREARVGSINIAGAKTGVMDKDRIPFDYQLVRPGVFKASPRTSLSAGEYGFIYAVNGGGTAGAAAARIFDFTVL